MMRRLVSCHVQNSIMKMEYKCPNGGRHDIHQPQIEVIDIVMAGILPALAGPVGAEAKCFCVQGPTSGLLLAVVIFVARQIPSWKFNKSESSC